MSGNGALPSNKRDLRLRLRCPDARLEWQQELHHGIDAPCQIGRRDILLRCPDASTLMHGGRRTVTIWYQIVMSQDRGGWIDGWLLLNWYINDRIIVALNLASAMETRSMPHCRGKDMIGLEVD
jgi:hypothetical protein